ncbi:hypothetical protein M8C13_18685 [Crossiella sp. SN42]|nr:hypothetical protein [Crossiella sp. SN42]MCO1577785.1 hypothetical protein [Crossiella sp. SN42]
MGHIGDISPNVAHLIVQGVLGPAGVAEFADAAAYRVVEQFELAVQGFAGGGGVGAFIPDDGIELAGEGVPYRFGQGDGVQVCGYGVLQLGHGQVRQCAAFVFDTNTIIVFIDAAVALGGCVDQPLVAAAPAPQIALEVVVVFTVAGTGSAVAVHGQHFLHPVEQVFCDKGFVQTGVPLAVLFNIAAVVAILKQVTELGQGKRAFGEVFPRGHE